MDVLTVMASLASNVLLLSVALCTLFLCAGKKPSPAADPSADAGAPGAPGYKSKSCNKREGLAMDDPDLKSDKLLLNEAAKTQDQPKTATTATTQETKTAAEGPTKTAGVAPTQEQTNTKNGAA